MTGNLHQENTYQKQRLTMHCKNIKLRVKKQLKKEFPNWKRLPKKMKREIVSNVMAQIL
jgi:hypothetical protein